MEVMGRGIKNAFLQADHFDREVYLQAPAHRKPHDTERVWKLSAPPNGLNDSQRAFYETLHAYLSDGQEILEQMGLLLKASSFGSYPYCTQGPDKCSGGATTTRIDENLRCGKRGSASPNAVLFGATLWET